MTTTPKSAPEKKRGRRWSHRAGPQGGTGETETYNVAARTPSQKGQTNTHRKSRTGRTSTVTEAHTHTHTNGNRGEAAELREGQRAGMAVLTTAKSTCGGQRKPETRSSTKRPSHRRAGPLAPARGQQGRRKSAGPRSAARRQRRR